MESTISAALEAVEEAVRTWAEAAFDVYREEKLDEMEIRVEVKGEDPNDVANAEAKQIRHALGFRAQVVAVPFGTLPRFDQQTRRITDHRDLEAVPCGGDSQP